MLPALFEKRMKELLGSEYDEFLAGYDRDHVAGLRLNRLKIDREEWDKISPFSLTPIPWIDNGYYYTPSKDGLSPTKHPYYYAGLYYIQEPSAMTPANLLPVEPGDRVLDMCAAPGGKSTELAAKLQGKGVLISNDISNTRAKALLKNLGVFGVKNSVIMSEDPKNLTGIFENYFDKILIDAPCSGEGMFRKDPAIMKNWEQYGVDYYNKIQKEIILYAAKMLRPGGMLLYSTCTFSPEENEGTIAWLLSHFPEFTIEPISNRYEGFREGRPEWIPGWSELPEHVKEKADSFRHLVRIWPHCMSGEGHFCALLRKGDSNDFYHTSKTGSIKHVKLEQSEEEFLHQIGFTDNEMNRVELHGDKLFLIPESLPALNKLRLLRNGLYLGDRKKNRFEPSQPLAMSLKKEQAPDYVDLSIDDPAVIKYLKCETIELAQSPGPAKGMTLVGTEGYPLGWGKRNEAVIKNKYFSGWRMM